MSTLVLYLIFAFFFLIDILGDTADQLPLKHILHESILFSMACFGAGYQAWKLYSERQAHQVTQGRLLSTIEDYKHWKEKSRLSAYEIRHAIDWQFDQWHFTSSEKDIALLLIKGLSMKEIASLRSTSEKTIRNQTGQIYRKSSVQGRQELAAYFLEEILAAPVEDSQV